MAVTAAVAAVMVPPGSWIVAGILRTTLTVVRMATYPTRLTLRALWWMCPLRLLFRRSKAARKTFDGQ
eukprot:2431627-Pyramimonas_sp.AAC.1